MFAGVVVFAVIGFKATSTYEKCLSDRSALALINSTNLPVCDLQRELDNVIDFVASHVWQFCLSTFFFCNVSECFWYRIGFHYFHWGNKSVSRRPTLGRVILSDAVHLGHRFTVRHARGPGHIARRHETLSESSQREDHRGNLLLAIWRYILMYSIALFTFTDSMRILLCHINCFCPRCWQLHLSTHG